MRTLGQRTINGAVYHLASRITGLNAKAVAHAEAEAKRARGLSARVVYLSRYDYAVYTL